MLVTCTVMPVVATLLKQLETIQNSCLRISLGVRMTSPIVSLNAESLIPPLNLRRNELTLKYISQILEQPGTSPVVKLYKSYISIPNGYKSSFKEVSDTISSWNITQPPANHCNSCSPVPPWISMEEVISFDFPCDVKISSDGQIKDVFSDMLSNTYNQCIYIYTDGSKDSVATRSAFHIFGRVERIYNLPREASVITSELYAIYQAALYYSQYLMLRKAVIFTDSLLALFVIQSSNSSYRKLTYSIQNILLNANNNLLLQWIPAHRGLLGNERADTLAKTITGPLRDTLVVLPREDYYNLIKENRKKFGFQTGKELYS